VFRSYQQRAKALAPPQTSESLNHHKNSLLGLVKAPIWLVSNLVGRICLLGQDAGGASARKRRRRRIAFSNCATNRTPNGSVAPVENKIFSGLFGSCLGVAGVGVHMNILRARFSLNAGIGGRSAWGGGVLGTKNCCVGRSAVGSVLLGRAELLAPMKRIVNRFGLLKSCL